MKAETSMAEQTQSPAAEQNDNRLIARFLQTIAAEKAAAAHTLTAYKNDLSIVVADLARLSSASAKGGVVTACTDDLRQILQSWHHQGLSARTNARRLSALRHFMSWMVADGYRKDNPAQFLDSPKLPQNLPKSLSEDEIIALIDASQHLPKTKRCGCGRAGVAVCRGPQDFRITEFACSGYRQRQTYPYHHRKRRA